MDWTLTGTTNLSHSEPGSNNNEGELHTLQFPRTGALPSNAV